MSAGERLKRWLITIRRILRTGFFNFVRNAWLSVAAMAVMLITLTIVLFSVIANATFANTIHQITDKIDISVYLKDSVTPEQRDKLIKLIAEGCIDFIKELKSKANHN